MKTISLILILTASIFSHAATVISEDDKNDCQIHRATSPEKPIQPNEIVMDDKEIYGFALKNLEIDFKEKQALLVVEKKVVLGFDEPLFATKVHISQNNPHFNFLINELNRSVATFEKVCVSIEGELVCPRDNDRLISILKELKELGNTLVVVEHDHDVIQNSEHIIEMGPGSGSLGGEVVFAGDTKQFFKSSQSITAQFVKPGKKGPIITEPRPVNIDNFKYKLTLKGSKGHNLKNLDVVFPLNRMVVVTGVSGSGKSTLVTKTLYPALARKLDIEFLPAQEFESLEGVENIKNVILIDQGAIGKSARSNPVTYLKAYDAIRTLMSSTPESKSRGYTPGTFSLNVDGGRCPACKGTGFEEIDMMFMDNVIIPCDICDSKKFRAEILEVQLYGKNIFQILSMTVKEALDFFVAHPNIRKPLSVLKEVGLDYIQLGQPANSLSGGESQRLKIAKELTDSSQKATLYILDEPTTGLHFREVDLLMRVLNKLIESGSSVILVEHNQDVIRQADYVIDLGPEAGHKGGHLVAQGSPADVIKVKKSLTGQFLKRYIEGS